MSTSVITRSTITCPSCHERFEEEMPTEACQYFWECPACHQVAKPQPGDCCVYCSYGTVKCPPIQEQGGCCC
jgi:hypothetical protein